MKKSMKRTLSLLLALTMVLSLGLPAYAVGEIEDEIAVTEEPAVNTATLPIGAGKIPGVVEEDEIISEDLIVDIVDEETVVEEEAAPAKEFVYSESATGFSVVVSAPAGALPLGTEMVVDRLVDLRAVQNAVDNAENLNGSVRVAADISFWLNGEEIEPAEGTKLFVRMSAPEIEGIAAPVVIHVPDGVNAVPEIVDQLDNSDYVMMADTVEFVSSDFSVYAVIDDGETGEEARVTVKFWKNATDEEPVATVYVKNADELLPESGERTTGVSYIEDIVFDPGIGGALEKGQLFLGWSPDVTGLTNKPAGSYDGSAYNNTTKPMTIEDVRKLLDSFEIVEGDELNVYAMIFKVFNVTYEDFNGVTVASEDVLCSINDTSAPYKITQDYTAVDDLHHFDGWHVKEGEGNITTTATDPFQLEDEMQISGNVIFSTVISVGHWLVFDENGKGATYNAPVFVKAGQKAKDVRPTLSQPENMERNGYDFLGWFLSDPAPVDYSDPNGAEFDFDQELTDKVIVYAKWRVTDRANYTIVVWKQKTTGGTAATDYDFSEAKSFTGTPNTVINIVDQNGASVTDANATYQNVVVTGWKEIGGSTDIDQETGNNRYLGFHAARFDSNVKINPNGTTVLNVYYDRNTVKLIFNLYQSAHYDYTYTKVAYTSLGRNGGTYYVPNSSGGYDSVSLRYRNNEVQIDNGGWFSDWQRYTGDWNEIYTRSSTYVDGGWNAYKTLTGIYGSKLTGWPSEYNWYADYSGSSADIYSTRTTFMDAYIPSSTSMIVDFYGASSSGGYVVHFLQKNASGNGYTDTNQVYVGTSNYSWFLTDKYTGFKCVAWNTSNNTSSWHQVGSLMQVKYQNNQWVEVTTGGELYYDADPDTSGFQPISRNPAGDLYIYYDRLSYQITYWDGIYKDTKDENLIEEDPVTQGFGASDFITYGASIANYGDPTKTEYKKPTRAGYYFAGWYADSTCNVPYTFGTMPLGGVQVYAKWVQIGYRVFLHPQAGTDASLDWGSASQKMCFSVGFDDKISAPTGRRNSYEFLGWYYSDGTAFNADTRLNDTTVSATPAYDKTVDMTDTIDKFGDVKDPKSNSDVDRPWITRKLDLYGKWSQVTVGALGIGVIYDANGGTKAPVDNRLYKDNVDAVAQAASTAPVETPAKQFLYWVIQTWDGEKFVDLEGEENHVYPGETFTVLQAYARITDNNNDNAVVAPADVVKTGSYTYSVQLRAEYGVKDAPLDTYIKFHANNGKTGDQEEVESHEKLQINQHVTIPTPEAFDDIVIDESVTGNRASGNPIGLHNNGCIFLGWAKLDMVADPNDPDNSIPDPNGTQPEDLTEADLWLKWVPAEGENDAHYVYTNKPVSQVAADEANPYQDLYAVWQKTFFVYHTSTGKVDRIVMTSAVDTINLTELVNTDSFLYGGYYKAYSGASDTFKADPAEMTWVDVTASTSGYDGNKKINEYADAGLVSKAQDVVKAYVTTENIAAAVWGDAYTNAGNNVTPANDFVNGQALVYYIKEVPIENYLRPNIKYTYNTKTKAIGTIWVVSGVDADAYEEAGFMFGTVENNKFTATNTLTTTDFADSLVFQATNTGATLTCTYANQCGSYGIETGKLYYATVFNDPDGGVDGAVNVLQNELYVQQYWKTPDGAVVTGKYVRAYEGIEKSSTLKPVNATVNKGCVGVGSTITFS